MAKFNKTNSQKTENLAGGTSYIYTDFKKEVVSTILASMLKGNSFYESEKDRIDRIEKYISENPNESEFFAKAMVYTRNEANLRSVSHLMGTLLVENVKGQTYTKRALFKSMIRPDDATEMVALWNIRNENKMIPNALKKAVKQSLETTWDAYQLKKYFGNGTVKVSDLVKLSHPNPKDELQKITFKQAIEGKLPAIDTAQTVNAKGDKDFNRGEMYLNMLQNNKLGYMAALKNIVNILESIEDKEKLEEVVELLSKLFTNKKAVLKSRLLPFRFYQAYSELISVPKDKFLIKKLISSIEKGFEYSAGNIDIVKDTDKVAILLDESGSMGGSPFMNGKVLTASILTGLNKDNVIGYLWAESNREINVKLGAFDFIHNTHCRGYGTDINAPLLKLIEEATYVDKIIIFTDMQIYNLSGNGTLQSRIDQYKKEINPDVKILFWNLEGYGKSTSAPLSNSIMEVSGYSDNLLKVVAKMWENPDALIEEIERIEL